MRSEKTAAFGTKIETGGGTLPDFTGSSVPALFECVRGYAVYSVVHQPGAVQQVEDKADNNGGDGSQGHT